MTDAARSAELTRKTGETEVSLKLGLDGSGEGTRETGVGFLDHMLDLFARHGNFDLTVSATGDLKTGAHHTVEDVGIVLGQALDKALGDRSGITRYATATIPMDEARASTSIDISGRPYVAFDGGNLAPGLIGDFDSELTEEFLRALANNSNLTLHVTVEAGTNAHHIVEAVFKSLARALRAAVAIDPDQHGVPSTKGTLTD
ncbi:MAG: imidazoleglycerol-phosphate dehydratase HisB [Solirubrobacterales bacterium]